jgi:anti-sigma regulatory factor (Ser/Thr protein kinase)
MQRREREFRVATTRLVPGLDALESALREERLPEATVLDLRLVAEEVLTNVAKYGHDDGAEHRVRMRLTLDPDEVTLEFTDDGRPFDPVSPKPGDAEAQGEEPSVGGVGLRLVLALMDAAAYARVGAENVLTLKKRLRAADGRMP